jgi:hypothetical protein
VFSLLNGTIIGPNVKKSFIGGYKRNGGKAASKNAPGMTVHEEYEITQTSPRNGMHVFPTSLSQPMVH